MPTFTTLDAIDALQASQLAREFWAIDAPAKPLPSYADRNFHLQTKQASFVLKIANPEWQRQELECENAALQHLAQYCPALQLPRVICACNGEHLLALTMANGATCWMRLLSFVEGVTYADFIQASASSCTANARRDLLRSLGAAIGHLARGLANFQHPATNRDLAWNIQNLPMLQDEIALLSEPVLRASVARHMAEFLHQLPNWQSTLPRAIIHNDANDFNVIVDAKQGQVISLIDFGDLCQSWRIAEVAITCVYAMQHEADPVQCCVEILHGFVAQQALAENELCALLPMIYGRICHSILMANRAIRAQPENSYILVSQRAVRKLLHQLEQLSAAQIQARFLAVLNPSPIMTQNIPQRSTAELIAIRQQHVNPTLSLSYQAPLKIVRGSGAYLYDESGQAYLDMVNNVCHVGHCHPDVVRAGQAQMAILNTNTRYLHDNLAQYALQLSRSMPSELSVVFFTNSGTEANDLALRLAQTASGGSDVMVVDHAYHGNSPSMIALSPYKFNRKGGRGKPAHVQVLTMPDGYRGQHRHGEEDIGRKYAQEVPNALAAISARGGKLAAFYAESILGCGGQVVLPPQYLQAVYAQVRAAGGVCVADEVQVGFGRVGSHVWGFEQQQVVPDIVTLGKPIGNGHPLGAVVTRPEIAQAFITGMEYFNTFAGNPVSCAIGLAVLEVIEREQLQQHAQRVGQFMLNGMQALAQRFPLIGEVRGSGLFLGIELVTDHNTLTAATQEAKALVEYMKRQHILLSTDGPLDNVIKIKPPMVFSQSNAEEFLDKLEAGLVQLA